LASTSCNPASSDVEKLVLLPLMMYPLDSKRNATVMKKRIIIGFLLLACMGCSYSTASVEKELKITLENKLIQDLSSTGLNYVFHIKIKNTSSKTYLLAGYNYRFVVNEKEYIRLQTPLDGSLSVKPSGETLIALPVKITYALLFQALGEELRSLDRVSCFLMGEMAFAEGRRIKGRLPFAFNGEFPIFKEPVIELAALKASAITLGGADLALDISVKNPNGFALRFDRISYGIEFGGQSVATGNIGGEKDIGGSEERTFSIALLLDFFETGQGVYAALQHPAVSCRVYGEFEIHTSWTRLVLPYDKSAEVTITEN